MDGPDATDLGPVLRCLLQRWARFLSGQEARPVLNVWCICYCRRISDRQFFLTKNKYAILEKNF